MVTLDSVFCRKKPPLRAAEFMAGNKLQLEQLRQMGIRIVTMKDGRVQLLHTAAEVTSFTQSHRVPQDQRGPFCLECISTKKLISLESAVE